MVALGPVIPLYFNPDMVNNLYGILIQEFIEARSLSSKRQVVVNVKAPLSEFSFDIWGRYVQGELNIQTVEEFVRQLAQENISASIIALKRLADILGQQNLLKKVDDGNRMRDVGEGDFVSLKCCLNENPVFQHVNNTIKKLEASKCCCKPQNKEGQGQTSSPNYDDILVSLKNGLNECRNSRCVRYVSEPILNSDHRAIVPCETKSMLVNNDYMLNNNVQILGKVTRTNNYGGAVSVVNTSGAAGTSGTVGAVSTAGAGTGGAGGTTPASGAGVGAGGAAQSAGATAAGIGGVAQNVSGIAGAAGTAGAGLGNLGFGFVPGLSGLNLLSGTYFDYLDYEQFNNLGGTSLMNAPVFSNFGGDIFNPAYPLLEVLPIAIFI